MKRYRKGLIYTNVGDILVSVNPFQQLDIYNDEVNIKFQLNKSTKAFSTSHVTFLTTDRQSLP